MLLNKPIKSRLIDIVFSIDCALFSICTLGGSYPYESFSSAAYRAEKNKYMYGKLRKYIDKLFLVIFNQQDHCYKAYTYAKLNLPEDMR